MDWVIKKYVAPVVQLEGLYMNKETEFYKKFSKKQILDELVEMCSKTTIVFVGAAGCGKSSIGHQVAKRLGLPFVDTDTEVENAVGMSAISIYEQYTEGAFRRTEAAIIRRLLTYPQIVMSTGDGAFLDPDLREQILSTTVTIWLHSDAVTLYKRLKNSRMRPHLVGSKDQLRTLEKLVNDRDQYYQQTHIKVISDDQTYNKMMNRVLYSFFLYQKQKTSGVPVAPGPFVVDYKMIDAHPIIFPYEEKAIRDKDRSLFVR